MPLQLPHRSGHERRLWNVATAYNPPMATAIPPVENANTLDACIGAADRALRALFAPVHASRAVPQPSGPREGAARDLSPDEQRRAAALMRVNHAGEIAAQALYHGQALAARSDATRRLLLEAAREETDHLAWCASRLKELDSRPSLLNPLWYAGSFFIGALAALAGDRASLGFVVETEQQVEGHLGEHLGRLPAADLRSRAIVQQMRMDEAAHGANARAAGAMELPGPARAFMRHTARIMTGTAYWV